MENDRRPTRAVTAVRQSPMNAQRWCCDLDCGHEVWITAKRRPISKKLACEKCGRAAA